MNSLYSTQEFRDILYGKDTLGNPYSPKMNVTLVATINGTEYTIDASEIKSESLKISGNSGESFSIGDFVGKTYECTIYDTTSKYVNVSFSGAEFVITRKIQRSGGDWYSVTVGTFVVLDCKRTANTVWLSMQDYRYKFDAPNTVNINAGYSTFYTASLVCSAIGITMGQTQGQMNNGYEGISYAENVASLSYAQVISYIAQMVGGFAIIGSDNKLYFKQYYYHNNGITFMNYVPAADATTTFANWVKTEATSAVVNGEYVLTATAVSSTHNAKLSLSFSPGTDRTYYFRGKVKIGSGLVSLKVYNKLSSGAYEAFEIPISEDGTYSDTFKPTSVYSTADVYLLLVLKNSSGSVIFTGAGENATFDEFIVTDATSINYSAPTAANVDEYLGARYPNGFFTGTASWPMYDNYSYMIASDAQIADYSVNVTGLKWVTPRGATYTSGTTDYLMTVEDNPFGPSNIVSVVTGIRIMTIFGVEYYPTTFHTNIPNIALEVGDIISIEDRNGKIRKVPVMRIEWSDLYRQNIISVGENGKTLASTTVSSTVAAGRYAVSTFEGTRQYATRFEDGTIVQYGWGWIQGNGTSSSITVTVTFPIPFTELRMIEAHKVGYTYGSAPTYLYQCSGEYSAGADALIYARGNGNLTTMLVTLNHSGTTDAAARYCFAWEARGKY